MNAFPNPFDLRGPQFLVFYICLGIGLLILLRIVRQRLEDDGTIQRHIFPDPYSIAYLREGKEELIRVAVISLIDRGLLIADGDQVSAKSGAEAIARKPIEKGILKRCSTPTTSYLLPSDPELGAMCEKYEEELVVLKLLPDGTVKRYRDLMFKIALLVLSGTAVAKIYIAIMRGKTNIGFLILLALLFPVLAYLVTKAPFRSIKGNRALAQLKESFSSLKGRAATITLGGGTTDVVILAAVFGLLSLPGTLAAQSRVLFPKLQSSSYGGSSCGSSCSSSSCGGGGCGGGCGGCG